MGLLLGAFHEPFPGRVDPLARRVGVLPLGDGPALADVLVEGLCDGGVARRRRRAWRRGAGSEGRRAGSSRARPCGVSHGCTWRAAATWALGSSAAVSSASQRRRRERMGGVPKLTLKKHLGARRAQRQGKQQPSNHVCSYYAIYDPWSLRSRSVRSATPGSPPRGRRRSPPRVARANATGGLGALHRSAGAFQRGHEQQNPA